MRSYITRQLADAQGLMASMLNDSVLLASLQSAAEACIVSLSKRGKILLAGNGGSAANAQHVAGEFVGSFAFDRPGLPAIALTTNSSLVTAVGNDYGFETLFARQVRALGNKGDVFIGYSTSGKSANILRAFEQAKAKGMVCVGLTGSRGGSMQRLCDFLLEVPARETPAIQEGHLVLSQLICGLVASAMLKAPK